MTDAPTLGGAILAGGASTRMGRDKAFIELEGRSLLARAAAALREGGAAPVVVVGGDRAAVEAEGLAWVPDGWPGQGPLGGIVTALRAMTSEVVMVLSCDLVDASPLAVRSVVGALGHADAAVPVVDGHEQWLHAAWRRAGALPRLEEAFAAGERAPRRAAEGLEVTLVLDGDPCWYHDADRPEDLPR